MADSVLSERAQRYLQTLKRRPHVSDLKQVRAALKKAGVPITQPVLDFHETFAGYVVEVWGDEGPLGIIHPTIQAHESFCQPMEVGGYLDDEEPEKSMLACADIHMSWEMLIELDGTYYCNGPESSSYFMWTEQNAYLWDFWNTRKCVQPELPSDTVKTARVLAKKLAAHRVDALCDDYGQVYGSDRFAVSIGQGGGRCVVLVAEGEWPAELADLKPRKP